DPDHRAGNGRRRQGWDAAGAVEFRGRGQHISAGHLCRRLWRVHRPHACAAASRAASGALGLDAAAGPGLGTRPPDATNQGFSGPLLRFNSTSIVPGGTPPGPGPGNPVPPADQKNGVDYQIIFEAEPVSGPSPGDPLLSNSLDRIHISNWLEV